MMLGQSIEKFLSPYHSSVYALAVHAVGHAAVAGDAVAEVLDVEGALEARGEEAAEGRDEGREAGEDEEVELVRHIGDRRDLAAQLWLRMPC